MAVASTGLCLLLGVHGGLINPVHELSSICFLVGACLHVFVNRASIVSHLQTKTGFTLAMLFGLITVLAMVSTMFPIGPTGHS